MGTVSVTFRGDAADDAGEPVACTAAAHENVVEIQFETEHGDVPKLATRAVGDVRLFLATDGQTMTDADGNEYASHAGDTENEPCSNRGLCDHATGICTCFAGFGMSDGLGGRGTIADCGYRLPH